MDCDFILDYQVKISYNDSDGSGVIVLFDNFPNNFFVFTSKHTFIGKDKKLNVLKSDEVKFFYKKSSIEFTKYIVLIADIIIFIFDKITEIEDLETIDIASSEKSFSKCIFRGYPRSQLDGGSLCEECTYAQIKEDREHIYQIRPIRGNTDTTECDGLSLAKGFSGSGLFIMEKNKKALVGIIKEREANISAYNYIALAPLMDNILKQIREGIGLKDDKNFIDIIKFKNKEYIEIEFIHLRSNKYNINVAIYPITYYQYDIFCKNNRKNIVDNYKKINRKEFPVVNIRWEDALLFCEWLTENSQYPNDYKLPKSDEWEFIANENMSEYNICYESDVPSKIGTNLGKKGIYDFLGNIEEFYENKVRKGGSYKDKLNTILNIKREKKITNLPKKEVGFRIVTIDRKDKF